MSYRKVVVSGDVIEIYEFEKDPVINDDPFSSKTDDYDPFDFDNTKLEPRDDRTQERREQTLRDARNTTRRLALMNFNDGHKFITLTFKENVQDILYADNEFKKFMKRFKYKFKLEKLNYIAVREFQKRGAIHFHMLCDWDFNFTCEEQIRDYERLLGQKVWKHGFVDIKQLSHVDNVGAYLIKYMTKNVSVEFFKGRKVYLCSQGLNRPFVYRGLEAEALIKAYDLDTKKEVFTNSYISEYLGSVTYKEFNLKR